MIFKTETATVFLNSFILQVF